MSSYGLREVYENGQGRRVIVRYDDAGMEDRENYEEGIVASCTSIDSQEAAQRLLTGGCEQYAPEGEDPWGFTAYDAYERSAHFENAERTWNEMAQSERRQWRAAAEAVLLRSGFPPSVEGLARAPVRTDAKR